MNNRANNRAYGLAALLAVVGVSVVFGMVIGGQLNTPRVALAAPAVPAVQGPLGTVQLAPAQVRPEGVTGFADIVEQALPAVVGVSNTQVVSSRRGEENLPEQFRQDPFFRWFFGDPEDDGDDGERRGPPRRDRPRTGFGSGFLVSPDGYILTNHHVIKDAERIVVHRQGGRRTEAKLIGADPAIDLALIKIDTNGDSLPTLPLGDSDGLRVGQWVIAIGNPLDFEQTVTVGVVSAKERQVPVGDTDISLAQFIQTDAAINFGNSGGPLLDGAGNVIGINTAISRMNLAEGIGFALPINEARSAMQQILANGRVQRGFLGITLWGEGIDDTAADYYGLPDSYGAVVQDVTNNEPADRAGLKKGDVIRKVNDKVVRDNRDLIQKISSKKPGDKVKLEIFRDGKTLTRVATLMERSEGRMIQAQQGERGEPSEPEESNEAEGLGGKVENLGPTARERLGVDEDVEGVVVVDVGINSPLADAGVGPGVIIVSINDRPTRNVAEWNRVVAGLKPGESIRVEALFFGGQSRFLFMRVPQD